MSEPEDMDGSRVHSDSANLERSDPTVERAAQMAQGTETMSREDIELRTRMYEARRAAIEAEERQRQNRENRERERNKAEARAKLRKVSPKSWAVLVLVVVAAIVACVIVIGGIAIPSLQPKPENNYITASDLEKAVNVSELSTIDYVHRGIAEKRGWFGLVDYRVRYKASMGVSFDMSQIRFEKDDGAKRVIAILPQPTVADPVIDESELDYLPESAQASFAEVLALCQEDAINEVTANTQVENFAYGSLKKTVEALTKPLLFEQYAIEFKYAAEMDGASSDSDSSGEAEHSDGSGSESEASEI